MRLKLGLVSDETGHNFTFTSPQAVALSEREKFKTELTNIIARNRSAVPTPAPTKTPGTPALPSAGGSSVASPRPPIPGSRPSLSRAASVSSDSRATPSGDTPNDFRIRKKVLLSTPELAVLHRELVIGGQITEAEFWEGREVRLYLLVSHPVSDASCSIFCPLRKPQKARREESPDSWLTPVHRQSMEKSRLSSRHSWYTTSSRSTLSWRRLTTTMFQIKCAFDVLDSGVRLLTDENSKAQ